MTKFNEKMYVTYPIQVAGDQEDQILYFVMLQTNLDSKENNNKKCEILDLDNLRASL